MHIWSWSWKFVFSYFPLNLILTDVVLLSQKHLQMCFHAGDVGRLCEDLSTIKRRIVFRERETLKNKRHAKPDLETLIILSADLAAVLTCPLELAHKLQGEEAFPEDQESKY